MIEWLVCFAQSFSVLICLWSEMHSCAFARKTDYKQKGERGGNCSLWTSKGTGCHIGL